MKTLSLSKLVASLAFATMSLMAGPAVGGPTTSGGGANFCYLPESGPVLLDLVAREKMPESMRVPIEQRVPGVKVPKISGNFKAFNPFQGPFEGPATGALERRVRALIQPFVTRYPAVGAYLTHGVYNTWFYAIPQKFLGPVAVHFEDEKVCGYANTRAVIAMSGGHKFVSRPAWNELDLDTQAHAVVHEGWRFAQVVLGLPITNKDLQELTYHTIADVEGAKNLEVLTRLHLWVTLDSMNGTSGYCRESERLLSLVEQAGLPHEALRSVRATCKEPLEISRGLYVRSNNALIDFEQSLNQSPFESMRKREEVYKAIDAVREFNNEKLQLMATSDLRRPGIGVQPLRADGNGTIDEKLIEPFLSDLLADFPVGK